MIPSRIQAGGVITVADNSDPQTTRPDVVEIAGRTFTIERVPDGLGGGYFACGILPMRQNRADLIRDIERSQGPEWRR